MHFKRQLSNTVFASKLRGFLPIRNNFFFPLPILHLGVFRWPAIGNPVRLGIARRASGTAGKTYDDFYVEDLRELNGLAKRFGVFGSVLRVGMDGIAVAAQRGDVNAAVFKFLFPRFSLAGVTQELIDRAMI